MSCIKQITIIETIRVVGVYGHVNWFVWREQYCYEEIVLRDVDCVECDREHEFQQIPYFRVLIGTDEYYVPAYAAVHDEKTIPDHVKSYAAYWEYYNQQPADWKKKYLELTGIDMNAFDTVQYNGMTLLNQINNRTENEPIQGSQDREDNIQGRDQQYPPN